MNNEEINKLLETLNSTGLEMVKFNNRAFKYQNHEVPHVQAWINKKEQELRELASKPITKKPQHKIINIINQWRIIIQKIPKLLRRIIEGVTIALIVLFVVWCINYYLHFNLKP